MGYLVIILMFGSTTIIFEAYPMNLLLALIGCKLYGGQTYEHRIKCT